MATTREFLIFLLSDCMTEFFTFIMIFKKKTHLLPSLLLLFLLLFFCSSSSSSSSSSSARGLAVHAFRFVRVEWITVEHTL